MSGRDGGPAFPGEGYDFDEPVMEPGMSLRDYFAGQALTGIIAAHAHPQAINPPPEKEAARNAYLYADAMLSERGKP